MTHPPFDTGPGPGQPGGPPQWGPAQPPGFGPPPGGAPQTPWGGGPPLAASNQVSRKRFLVAMAFFGLLFVGSVAGFFLTTGRELNTAITDTRRITPPLAPEASPPASAARPGGPVPKPVTYRGSGTKVLKVRRPERGEALVYVKGRPGDGLFTVFGLDAKGRRNGFVITSLEPYEGVRLLDVTSVAPTAALEIEARGPWVVEVRSARGAKAFDDVATGTGDMVLRYTGRAAVATIRGGQPMRPFLVFVKERGFPRAVVTSVGAFAGEKPLPAGPVLVEVQATGRWSIRAR